LSVEWPGPCGPVAGAYGPLRTVVDRPPAVLSGGQRPVCPPICPPDPTPGPLTELRTGPVQSMDNDDCKTTRRYTGVEVAEQLQIPKTWVKD